MTRRNGPTLRWRCHVCGEERPDPFIHVYTEQRWLSGVTVKVNVRYCNDRPECKADAHKVAARWRGEPVDEPLGPQ